MAAGCSVAAEGGGPCQGGGSGVWGVVIQSVPEKYDEETAGAVGVEMDLSVVAVTGVWGRVEGIVLDWLNLWAVLGPVNGGVEKAAGDSWGHCVGLENHQVQGAAAVGATSGEGPAGVKLGMLVGHPEGAVDTVVAVKHPLDPVVAEEHPLSPC